VGPGRTLQDRLSLARRVLAVVRSARRWPSSSRRHAAGCLDDGHPSRPSDLHGVPRARRMRGAPHLRDDLVREPVAPYGHSSERASSTAPEGASGLSTRARVHAREHRLAEAQEVRRDRAGLPVLQGVQPAAISGELGEAARDVGVARRLGIGSECRKRSA